MSASYYRDRYARERSPPSDEDRYKTTTVRRYKVSGADGSSNSSRVVEQRYEEEDDRRSRYSHVHPGRGSHEHIEIDRHERTTYLPERPRSAFDPPDRGREREREVAYYRGDDDRYRIEVEEDKPITSPRGWDRSSRHWDEDVRYEKRVEKRDSDGDVKIEKKVIEIDREEPREHKEKELRVERRIIEESDPHDYDVERYRKEVEYYSAPDPPVAPVIIRQRAPEQKIIVQEAPPPAPIVLPRQDPGYVVLREENQISRRPDPRYEDDYYRREEAYALERRDRDRRYRYEDRHSDDGYDEDYYIKRTVITRDRSSSSDHHKRHLAEGGLAGAGLAALISTRRGKDGNFSDNRGRKVLGGAVLGALGTEVVRRAKSAYEDRYGDDEDDHHHRHRSKSRSRLATGLALGAAALAVAGGIKYMQSDKEEREEATRGRTRRRHSYSSYSGSRSRSGRGRSRSKSNAAKAAVATSAIAGLVQHYRSKSRGKSRSKSRIRTGAEIAAAGLSGAAASKLWERHKEKKEKKDHHRSRDRDVDEDDYYDRHRSRSYSRGQSRSRSRSRSLHSGPPPANRELGLVPVVPGVEYGSEPLGEYESASDERKRRRRRRHRDHDRSRDRSVSVSDSDLKKKRSRSRLREAAAGIIGTGAAAIGIKKYNDRQKSKEREQRSREQSRERSRDGRSRDGKSKDKPSRRSRDRERRRYEEEIFEDPHYDEYDAPPSPPHASGGAYYPPPGGPDYHSSGPVPPQPGGYSNPEPPMNYPGGPGSGYPQNPENVSRDLKFDGHHPESSDVSRSVTSRQDGVKLLPAPETTTSSTDTPATFSPPLHSAKVKFGPLSPKSSMTLQRHHEETGEYHVVDEDDSVSALDLDSSIATAYLQDRRRQRSNSDDAHDRPQIRRRRMRGDESPHSDEDEVEFLPERFDSNGRPVHGRSTTSEDGRIYSRRGDFEYRPRNRDAWNASGSWAVAGTEAETVENIARTVTKALDGSHGFLGILGSVLQNSLALPNPMQDLLDNGDAHGSSSREERQRNGRRTKDSRRYDDD